MPCFCERGGGQLVLLGPFELVGERVALPFHGAQGLAHGKFARDIAGLELRLEFLDLAVLGGGGLLQFAGGPGLGEFDGGALVALGQFQPLVQLLLEIAVAHLLQDVRVAGFVDLECLAAMGADDFVHGYVRSTVRVGVDRRGSAAKRRAVRAGSREVMLFIGSGTWSHPTVAGQEAPASGRRLKTEADVCERMICSRSRC
ncbi:hypothetical protein FQZ97_1026350 [compost metagenome]